MLKLDLLPADRSLLLALDRDGTLVPYAPTPDQAVMAPEMTDLLSRLACLPNLHLAIVSARSIRQLEEDVNSPRIILAGNYGLEINFPKNKPYVNQFALEASTEIQTLKPELIRIAGACPGAVLEDHTYSMTLHYLNVEAKQHSFIAEEMARLTQSFARLKLRPQPTSFELLPAINWTKAQALDQIQEILGLADGKFFPIIIGDTSADEPAIEWANRKGGWSLRVAEPAVVTAAQMILPDPSTTFDFLKQLMSHRV
jgi:trehalose 6-phosphate phosphatase